MNFLNRYCVSLVFFTLINIHQLTAVSLYPNSQKCEDPSEVEIEKIWSNARNWWNENLINKSNREIEETFSSHIFIYHESKGTFGSWRDNPYNYVKENLKNAQCEYFYLVRFRENRFPKSVVEGICSSIQACPYATNKITSDFYKCSQVFKYELALERGDCINNVYSWKIGIEKIPSDCNCMREAGTYM